MKEIKTIYIRRDRADDFDRLVNQSLRKGWTLVRRYALGGFNAPGCGPCWVAELEREVAEDA